MAERDQEVAHLRALAASNSKKIEDLTIELTEANQLSEKQISEKQQAYNELESENDALTSLNLITSEKTKCLEIELEEVAIRKAEIEGQLLTQENEFILLKSGLELELGDLTKTLEMLSEKCSRLEAELEQANAKTRRGSEELLDLQGKRLNPSVPAAPT